MSYVVADYDVITNSGIAQGYKKNNILYWDDIPYAKPPIDDLRWKAPRSINQPQKLILPKDNNFCVQRPSSLGGASGDGIYVGTEDCLYLDIAAPAKKKSELIPVMFWIHGGGNTSGLKDLYDFSKMAKKHDVLIVRINYRLGPFGWFTHPSIQEFQTGLDRSSNYGTLDIIEALKWVKANIEFFGGDPNNVTIFGESAGGHNVYSLISTREAKGLFHKAISMSGYTTSISAKDAYKPNVNSSTYNHSSFNIVNKILENQIKSNPNKKFSNEEIRDVLLNISTEEFFKHYSKRKSYEEIPLLTADDIVIPAIGLKDALGDPKLINMVPTIAGSNRDEVKLWLGTAEYFVELDYSPLGSILNIPKVVLKNEESFEAFNYYRSSAWKIRGVDIPVKALHAAGNTNLYSYRYDWDDHRKYFVADFKKLIGAAHATEIPLLAGNSKLVGGYPLSDLIYPPGLSKFYLSRNMMIFWSNFAKSGIPGESTNSIIWKKNMPSEESNSTYLILDNKKNLRMDDDNNTLKSLSEELFYDDRLTELEKCVVLLQMFTFVGNDEYDDNIKNYPGSCNRSDAEQFLKANASYIEY
tara:strand:- start:1223 stop:2971 length:1749 start_codon:yes stop_codon:yes gene_type:complete